MAKKLYTTFDVGAICGVYPTTVINWVREGKLPAFTTPGGHRRVRRDDLLGFLQKYDFPVPADLSAEAGPRVLVVDDDASFGEMVRKAFRQYLPEAGVRILQNGVEAIVEIGKAAPDLLILDVVMPVVDGLTVCATLRSHADTRNLRIIGVTGKRLPERSLRLFQERTDAFFRKPLDPKELVRRSRELLKLEAAKAAV